MGALPDDARAQIDAYIAGVNAFLASDPPLPPEFTLLRFKPAPWTGPDVLVWVKMMAWDLSANYSHELIRHDLLARVGPQRTAELMPPYPQDGLSILSVAPAGHPDGGGERTTHATDHPPVRSAVASGSWSGAFAQALDGDEAVRQRLLGGGRIEALGSNNWVVDGTLSATGKPLLANDPHLGTHVPSLWYLAHMSAGDFDVVGANAARRARGRDRPQPSHRLGRNQRGRRRPGPLSRTRRSDWEARRIPRRARADAAPQGNDQGERRGSDRD
jgi:penicillin amidase